MQPVTILRFLNRAGKNEALGSVPEAEPVWGGSAAVGLGVRTNPPLWAAESRPRDEAPSPHSSSLSPARCTRTHVPGSAGSTAGAQRRVRGEPPCSWVCKHSRDRTALLGVRACARHGAGPWAGRQRDRELSLSREHARPAGGVGASRLPAGVCGAGSVRVWTFPAACVQVAAPAPRCTDLQRLRRARPRGVPGVLPWAPCPHPPGCSAGCDVCCASADHADPVLRGVQPRGFAEESAGAGVHRCRDRR